MPVLLPRWLYFQVECACAVVKSFTSERVFDLNCVLFAACEDDRDALQCHGQRDADFRA